MCGLVGIYGHDYVAQDTYDALMTLQHRGQDAAGMITYDGKFHERKDNGLVNEVFRTRHMKKLQGYVAVAHTRYATMGTGDIGEIQPFLGQSPFGVVIAHNGNIFNSPELKKEIYEIEHRLVNSESDGEVLLHIFSKNLSNQLVGKHSTSLTPEQIWRAVAEVYSRAKGAYSVVAYIARQGMLAFRDPHGIRPLILGKRQNGLTIDYIFASESVTLDILGFEIVGDLAPGEAVFIDEATRTVHRRVIDGRTPTPCIFEYIYFARPDSVMNGISVYKAQIRMGEKLAKQIRSSGLDIDVVMPVPDSARAAALAIAEKLGLKYREGLVKNRYVGRTFIMPGQKIRKKSIRYKLNPMRLEIEGKKILLVDDSIVRGNTSRQIVEMVREAGAEKIYFASFSPPVLYPNLYGIDIPTTEELIASNNSLDTICKFIGADALFYGTIKDIYDSCHQGNPKIKDFDMSCFDGVYKTGDVTSEILKRNAETRLENKRCGRVEDEPDSQLNLM